MATRSRDGCEAGAPPAACSVLDGDGASPAAAQGLTGEGGCHSVGDRVAGCSVVPVMLVLPCLGLYWTPSPGRKDCLLPLCGGGRTCPPAHICLNPVRVQPGTGPCSQLPLQCPLSAFPVQAGWAEEMEAE